MTIAVYNASWSTFGGGEKYLCAIAQELARTPATKVTLLIDRPEITADQLRRYFNLDLAQVQLKYIGRGEHVDELRRSDTAIIVSNFRPFGTPARRTVYVLQIPYAPITSWTMASGLLHGNIKETAKDLYRISLLRDARQATTVLVYSEFVQKVLERAHGVHSEVLYPAIDNFGASVPKEHAILSVGRFFTGLYNDKRYDILIDAFKKLCARLPNLSWQYWLAGSCGSDPRSQQYLAHLRALATGFPIYFHINASYDELRRLYNQASIFWHAAGFGIDEERHPERMEHFGMSTVEAMTASCVPVVINKGGQKEIVSHGDSGYLWNTSEELVTHTATLIEDTSLLDRTGVCARDRSGEFNHEHFARRLRSLIPV